MYKTVENFMEIQMLDNYEPSLHITGYFYGDIKATCLMSWIDLSTHLARSTRNAQLRSIREDALISRSRCRATKQFLDSGSDVWIQIDHDIQFDTKDLMKAAQLAHDLNAIVQIPYPCRALPPRPAHRPNADAKPIANHPELTAVTFFASGCVCIPKKALELTLGLLDAENQDNQDGFTIPNEFLITWCNDGMVEMMPTLWMPFAMTVAHGTEYLSEDYAASARFSLAGIPQYVMQPSKHLNHWGDFPFTLADSKTQS